MGRLTSSMHVDVVTFVLHARTVFAILGIVLGRLTLAQRCNSGSGSSIYFTGTMTRWARRATPLCIIRWLASE